MGQIKCKMTPPKPQCVRLPVFGCVVTPVLWCRPLLLPRLVCLCLSAVLRASPMGLSSFWKKRKVSCPGQRCGELVWRTDRRGPSKTPTGRKGPSATRPGTCPSTAGQSLCAYHPKAKDKEASERKTGEKCHAERPDGGVLQDVQGRLDSLIKLPVRYWLQRHHNHLSSQVDHLFFYLISLKKKKVKKGYHKWHAAQFSMWLTQSVIMARFT